MLALAIVLGIIVIEYFHTRRLIGIGTELANKAVAFEAHPASPTQHFLVVGDSSAVGVGSVSPEGSVAGRLGADFPQADITNHGVSGSKVADLLSQLKGLDQGAQYDLILIQIGGNDIVRRTPYANLERDLPQALKLATAHSDNVVLLTSGNVGTSRLLPYGTRWFFTLRTQQVRRIFQRITKEYGVHYVDLYRARSEDPYAHDPEKYYAPDFFHPSAEGYGDWYTFVKATIDTLPDFQK